MGVCYWLMKLPACGKGVREGGAPGWGIQEEEGGGYSEGKVAFADNALIFSFLFFYFMLILLISS